MNLNKIHTKRQEKEIVIPIHQAKILQWWDLYGS